MRDGKAHQVPLIVGTNAEEAQLFTRFLPLLPMTQPMIERLLADADAERRDRITSAYRGYPASSACVQLGGDFAFGTAAWQVAEAHGRHAPTYVYRYDYAPRTLRWSGLGATHATELLAVFDTYRTRFGSLLTAAADRRSARKVSNDVQARWRAFSRTAYPAPAGRRIPQTSVRSWCSTATPASSTTLTPTADWPGKVSRWPHRKRRVIRRMPAQRPRM
jgi:para-nitrobenzyl esterase